MKVRTRYAPSPTGYMHVGNLRSAIFEYLVAKKDNGDFILRIEDTDQGRIVEGSVEFIYDTLSLCGIKSDEGPLEGGEFGPYTQSERLHLYKDYALELVKQNKAYYCFCDQNRLEKLREESEAKKVPFLYDGHCKVLTEDVVKEKIANGEKYVIRQKMPKEGFSEYDDIVYGKMSFENKLLEDQILLKSDGFPTYNFANVVDDHLMNITHVVRGNEYLTSTPKYNLLYDAFGWDRPTYIHLPWVVDSEGKKLSKRHGAASFMDLYNKGYLAEGIVNYLVFLGFKPETTDEIFTLEELTKIFDPKRISKSPAIFDVKKLNWVNAHYIKKLTIEELLEITVPHLEEKYDLTGKSSEWIKHLVSIYQDHISYGAEIVDEVSLFFEDLKPLSEEALALLDSDRESVDKVIESLIKNVSNCQDWSVEEIKNIIKTVKEETGVKGKMLFMPTRIAVSGIMHGPELPDTIYLLGKETVIERLKKFCK